MPTDATLEPLRTRLRRANLRATAPRIAVLRAMDAAGRPLSHAELFQVLGGDAAWDRATIYRNLSDLTDVGLLRRYDLGDHTWRFEPAAAHPGPTADTGHAHAHFTCVDCGAVSCVDDVTLRVPDAATVPRALATSAVEIQLRGQCDACAPA
jgi:Fur family ferric uptake transcriptional regulator